VRLAFVLLAVLLVSAACSGEGSPAAPEETATAAAGTNPDGPARAFAMGFTPFPYAVTQEALRTVDEYLARDGDLVVMHFDNGVPWREAEEGLDYPPAFVGDVDRAVAAADAGQVRVLQITPINFLRDGLAPGAGNAPLQPPWDTRDFDDGAVISTYLEYARWMIERTEPDYVNYAIEANLLFEKSPDRWESFLRLAAAIYASLKADYPDISFFTSIQLDAIATAPEAQMEAIEQMLAYSDVVAVSAYPFTAGVGLEALPGDFLSAVAELAPDKPFAVSETAWPAEDLGPPYPATVPATPGDQREYLSRLLTECERLGCLFVDWFVVRDYDLLFQDTFAEDDPLAAIARIWRDTGLYDGNGGERPALTLWREWLARPRR
jgi:hypothetical protein